MRRLFVCTLTLLGGICMLYAQQDYESYMQKAGDAVLYRHSEVAPRYRFVYEGSPYVDSDMFVEGEFLYDGVLYRNVLLNYNAEKDVLHLKVSDNSLALVMNSGYVEYFTMGTRKFVNKTDEKAVEGTFYEVLADRKDQSFGQLVLYRRITKIYYKTADGEDHKVRHSFEPRERFWLQNDGKYIRISSARDIMKMFPEQKKAIKAAIKRAEVRPRTMEAMIIAVNSL